MDYGAFRFNKFLYDLINGTCHAETIIKGFRVIQNKSFQPFMYSERSCKMTKQRLK